ncbi:MAG: pilus assembly PilX N-terminal domain-containing protein [Thermodesulfobacteriota bacterium]
MSSWQGLFRSQRGSVINVALLILILITVVVFSLSRTSTTDIKIAGNERQARSAFYAADGGTAVGGEILEQNIACPSGFTATLDDADEGLVATINNIRITDLDFWANEVDFAPGDPPADSVRGDGTFVGNRHLYFPADYGPEQPHTNLTVSGRTVITQGSSIQMAAGYEGKGKGAAGGGVHLVYDIWAQYVGVGSSEAEIVIGWRHVVGMEGECNY